MRNSLVLVVQISDLIFKLARFLAPWKARDNHVGAGRGILAAHGWPISHNLADAEFVGWHRLDPRLDSDFSVYDLRRGVRPPAFTQSCPMPGTKAAFAQGTVSSAAIVSGVCLAVGQAPLLRRGLAQFQEIDLSGRAGVGGAGFLGGVNRRPIPAESGEK
jgi:hypothetical protein